MIDLYNVVKSQPGYFKQLSYKDLLVTQYDCPQIESKESFFNESYYIAYIISGKRTFYRQTESWELSEGKSVFVKQGAHISGKNESDGWCVMIFFLPGDYLRQFIRENHAVLRTQNLQPADEKYVIELHVTDTTRSFFYSMLPYFTQQPQPNDVLVDLKFKEMLFNVLSDPGNAPLLSYLVSRGQHNPGLQEVMETNYLFNLSLEQFAKLANLSLATYQREFRKIYQLSPAKWLKEKRLQHAAGLLQTTQMRVQDIAYESGFENLAHFSRSFKEIFALSPLAYREKQLG